MSGILVDAAVVAVVSCRLCVALDRRNIIECQLSTIKKYKCHRFERKKKVENKEGNHLKYEDFSLNTMVVLKILKQ